LLGVVLGTVGAALVLPTWLPDLTASAVGTEPKAYWYLSRAAGLVAYLLLWLSITLGLAITNRLVRAWPGGPTALDLHQFCSLLALGFALFHGLILLGDRYINYTLAQLVIPFADGDYRPFWVGLGQLSFYLAILITFSFNARRFIGLRAWRILHYASFALYAMVTAHGIGAGTDSTMPMVLALYIIAAATTFFLTLLRVLLALPLGRPGAAQTGDQSSITTNR
jgi:predicted ferric reductase